MTQLLNDFLSGSAAWGVLLTLAAFALGTLINKVAEGEKKLACIEQTSLDLKTLLKVLRSSTSFEELTPTLVNSLIRRIEVHNNDKSSGHCYVKVDIYFTAIGLIDIPTEDEIKSLMAKIKANPQEYRLTA